MSDSDSQKTNDRQEPVVKDPDQVQHMQDVYAWESQRLRGEEPQPRLPEDLQDPETGELIPLYTTGTWRGIKQYICRLCKFTTFYLPEIEQHLAFRHKLAPQESRENLRKVTLFDADGKPIT